MELTHLFTAPLIDAQIVHMVTGSIAGVIYGEPRLTHDVDMVLKLTDADVRRLEALFPDDEFYLPPIENIMMENKRGTRGHFNIIHHDSGFKADMYLAANDPLHAWGLAGRREMSLESRSLFVAPPEYVIVKKLEFLREGGSEKHVRDIRGILTHSEVDRSELSNWIDRRKLDDEWARVEASQAKL